MQTPESRQKLILDELSVCKLSDRSTKSLLRQLAGMAFCGSHRIRQADRFLRRWGGAVKREVVRRRQIDVGNLRQEDEEHGEDGGEKEMPDSPSPLPRRKDATNSQISNNSRLEKNDSFSSSSRMPVPCSNGMAGSRLPPTPRPTPPKTEFPGRLGEAPTTSYLDDTIVTPTRKEVRQHGPFPSINALISKGRKYSFSSNNSTSGSFLTGSRIPRLTTRDRGSGTGRREFFTGRGSLGGFGGGVNGDAIEEVRVLQDSILKFQMKILKDQERIFEVLLGGRGGVGTGRDSE